MSLLQSQVASIGDVWNDKISKRVKSQHIDALLSKCKSFYSFAYVHVHKAMQEKASLNRIWESIECVAVFCFHWSINKENWN